LLPDSTRFTEDHTTQKEASERSKVFPFLFELIALFIRYYSFHWVYLKTGENCANPVMVLNQMTAQANVSHDRMSLRRSRKKSEGRVDKFTNKTLSSIPQNNLRFS